MAQSASIHALVHIAWAGQGSQKWQRWCHGSTNLDKLPGICSSHIVHLSMPLSEIGPERQLKRLDVIQHLNGDSCVHSLEKMLTIWAGSAVIVSTAIEIRPGFGLPVEMRHQNCLLKSLPQVPLIKLILLLLHTKHNHCDSPHTLRESKSW